MPGKSSCLLVYLAICDSRALPLRNVSTNKTESAGICQPCKNCQACSIPHVLLLSAALLCVTLSGKHGRPQGKALVCCLDWNPLVWSDGRCRDRKYIFVVTCVSTAGPFDPCSFWWACFFFFSKLFPIFFSRIKCSFKVDYKDYLETWFLCKWV